MKYIPKEIKGNVNVSSQSPLKDFWVTVFKLLGVLLAVYIILGMILDFMAPRISLKMEQKIGVLLSQRFLSKQNPAGRDNLQKILDNLLVNASLPALNYRVYIYDAKEPNALALPGGSIIVFTPLLKKIESENEVAMV
ncbi:MAG: M48 family metalloprotease, partial [Candidatus Omnitrophota bacterium]